LFVRVIVLYQHTFLFMYPCGFHNWRVMLNLHFSNLYYYYYYYYYYWCAYSVKLFLQNVWS